MLTLRRWLRQKWASSPQDNDPLSPPVLPSRQQPQRRETSAQEQSIFFSNLPVDVRLLIYGEIFGNRSIHVMYKYWEPRRKGELWHCVCRAPELVIFGDECPLHAALLMREPPFALLPPTVFAYINISILMSCRRAYSEGIGLLYGTNEFRFHDMPPLCNYPFTVLPQCLARITALTFFWSLPYGVQPHVSERSKRTYAAKWQILASAFPRLRTFRAVLNAPGICVRGDSSVEQFQQAWLEPLGRLSQLGLQNCEIYVPASFYFYLKEVANRGVYELVQMPNQGLIWG